MLEARQDFIPRILSTNNDESAIILQSIKILCQNFSNYAMNYCIYIYFFKLKLLYFFDTTFFSGTEENPRKFKYYISNLYLCHWPL